MNTNICYFCGQEPASELGMSVDINTIRYFWKSIQYQLNVFDASFNSPQKLGVGISTGYWKREMYD